MFFNISKCSYIKVIFNYRYYLLRKGNESQGDDGLRNLKYSVFKIQKETLFTYILADIDVKDPVYYLDHKQIVVEYLKAMREVEETNEYKENMAIIVEDLKQKMAKPETNVPTLKTSSLINLDTLNPTSLDDEIIVKYILNSLNESTY